MSADESTALWGLKTRAFMEREVGKVTAYRVFNLRENQGFVSVGADDHIAAFVVQGLRNWWEGGGKAAYPKSKPVPICIGVGRVRVAETELARLTKETGPPTMFCHFPPATSKWKKVEHGRSAATSFNWQSKPFTRHEAVVNLTGVTTTRTDLKVEAELGQHLHSKERASIFTRRKASCPTRRWAPSSRVSSTVSCTGEWSYSVRPRAQGTTM